MPSTTALAGGVIGQEVTAEFTFSLHWVGPEASLSEVSVSPNIEPRLPESPKFKTRLVHTTYLGVPCDYYIKHPFYMYTIYRMFFVM